MCRHVAAVIYGVGVRLDNQPEFLFVLREIDHQELIAGAVNAVPIASAGNGRRKKTIAAGDLADVFEIEMVETEADGEISKESAPKATKIRAASATTQPGSTRKSTRAPSGAKQLVAANEPVKKKGTKTVQRQSRRARAVHAQPTSRTRAKQGAS
jgi:uncharacterized Zn finger protein